MALTEREKQLNSPVKSYMTQAERNRKAYEYQRIENKRQYMMKHKQRMAEMDNAKDISIKAIEIAVSEVIKSKTKKKSLAQRFIGFCKSIWHWRRNKVRDERYKEIDERAIALKLKTEGPRPAFQKKLKYYKDIIKAEIDAEIERKRK